MVLFSNKGEMNVSICAVQKPIKQRKETIEFKHYSQFKSLKDFNNQYEMWMADYKHQFTATEYIALNRLRKYCAKVWGVSNAMIRTILEAIEERDCPVGVSRSTFKRMIVKAKRIGLVEVIELERKDGSQSSNLYIFQRYDSRCDEIVSNNNTIEPPTKNSKQPQTAPVKEKVFEQLNHHKAFILSSKAIITRTSLDHSYIPNYVNQLFVETTIPFFGAKEICQLWQRVKTAYKHSKLEKSLDDCIDTIIKSFKKTVLHQQLGNIKKSFVGYFYKIVYEAFADLREEELKIIRFLAYVKQRELIEKDYLPNGEPKYATSRKEQDELGLY